LDGIEKLLEKRFSKMKVHFIRYCDDFLVIVPSKEIADEVREIIRDFLTIRGLELSPEKTVITHIDDGFDFLSWNFRKYKGKLGGTTDNWLKTQYSHNITATNRGRNSGKTREVKITQQNKETTLSHATLPHGRLHGIFKKTISKAA